jgi:catalase
MHMFSHLLDDIGIPADFRHMDGSGVHTYKWISATGKEKFVKYTWVSHQGVVSLINDSQVQAITNPQFATLDLYTSILKGDYPSWTLQVQLLDPTDVILGFDPLDPTKIWPTDVVPLITVGVLTLNQTLDNIFNENEQLAFSPSNVVPGLFYSDDKLLQARLFSYPDTQRYRLGGNYLLLPVNAPRCPFLNHQYDGVMNFVTRTSEVNYFPSRVEPWIQNSPPFPTDTAPLAGTPTRGIIPLQDDFQQPGQRFLSWDKPRQDRFIARLVATLQPPLPVPIRTIVIGYWTKVDNTILGPALRRAFP